jgi:hypothetical protein
MTTLIAWLQSETMAHTYDRPGRLKWKKGQALSSTAPIDATKHSYTYDSHGSLHTDTVTAMRTGVDEGMDYTFDQQGSYSTSVPLPGRS